MRIRLAAAALAGCCAVMAPTAAIADSGASTGIVTANGGAANESDDGDSGLWGLLGLLGLAGLAGLKKRNDTSHRYDDRTTPPR